MMTDPVNVYREWLSAGGGKKDDSWTIEVGRNEVLLMVEHRVRLLREVEGASLTALGKQEIITTLQGILAECRAAEAIPQLYDKLAEWRKLRFEPVPADG